MPTFRDRLPLLASITIQIGAGGTSVQPRASQTLGNPVPTPQHLDNDNNQGETPGDHNELDNSPPKAFVDPTPISFVGPPDSHYIFQNPPPSDYRFIDPAEGCAGDGTPRHCRDTQKDCCQNPNDPSRYICCIPPRNATEGSGSRGNPPSSSASNGPHI